jgi:histidinol-phosphate aminotransferase
VGHPDFIAGLEKIRQPFNLNAMAQAAALAAIDDEEHVQRTRENNAAGLQFFETAFSEMNIKTIPSHANFICAQVGDGRETFMELQKRGVIARDMSSYQMPEWIRITIGTPEQNERCLAALKDLR